MFNIYNNSKSSEFIIINIKPNIKKHTLYNEITLDDEFNILNNWIQSILDKYDNTINWNYYMVNINNSYYRIFIFINKHNYLNMDNETLLYFNNNISTNLVIDINKLVSLFTSIDLFIILQYLKKNISNVASQIILLDSNYHNIIKNELDNLQHDINDNKIIYYNIGISGINKYDFYKELSKIEILLNNTNEEFNIYKEIVYIKIKESNKDIWVCINNDSLIKYLFNKFEKFTSTPNKNKNI